MVAFTIEILHWLLHASALPVLVLLVAGTSLLIYAVSGTDSR